MIATAFGAGRRGWLGSLRWRGFDQRSVVGPEDVIGGVGGWLGLLRSVPDLDRHDGRGLGDGVDRPLKRLEVALFDALFLVWVAYFEHHSVIIEDQRSRVAEKGAPHGQTQLQA